MKHDATNRRLCLKEGQERGWFAAGDGFRRALLSLSDGAFKLFAWLCLEARRESGRLETTHKELAGALGKSKRAVGTYVSELEAKGVCRVELGTNQYAPTRLEICEVYWPYQTAVGSISPITLPDRKQPGTLAKQGKPVPTQTRTKDAAHQLDHYVRAVRELFIQIGCGKRSFNVADARFAGQLHQRGVGLPIVENALLLGETRKWASWLNRGGGTPISSLRYFEPLIAEVQQSQQTFTEEYRRYLRSKIRTFASACANPERSRLEEQRSEEVALSSPMVDGTFASAKR